MYTFLKSQKPFSLPRLAALSLFFLASVTTQVQAELVDRVVAVVNSEVILLSELQSETKTIHDRIKEEIPLAEQTDALAEAQEQALDSIIDKKLINQTAKQARVSVSEKEIDKAVADVRKRANLSEEAFIVELQNSGLSLPIYRDNVKSQLLQRKIVNYDIRAKIVISDSMVKEYYDQEYTVTSKIGEFYLLQIGFLWDKNSKKPAVAKAQAQKDAQRIHNLAVNGADFSTLAKKYSQLPSAADGGDIGSFTIDDMSAQMAKAISPLALGDVSNIIETPSGYQFFKVLSGTGGTELTKAPFEQVKDTIRATLFEKEMHNAYTEWITSLKEDAYIQKM